MSEEKEMPKGQPAEDLTKTKKPGDVQLTEEELAKASGGAGGEQEEYYKIHMENT